MILTIMTRLVAMRKWSLGGEKLASFCCRIDRH